jgi:hypothetical protein
MAIKLVIICAVAGAILSLRYNVLVLVPAVAFAMLFAIIAGVARADSFWSIVLMTAALGAAVQIGYLAGIAINAVIELIRAALSRGRHHEPEATVPHTWRTSPLRMTSGSIAGLHRPQPPQV